MPCKILLYKNKQAKEAILSMRSVTEILGGAQILLGISYDIQDVFEDYLTETHRLFLSILRIIDELLPQIETNRGGRGRKAYETVPFIRGFLAKSIFKLETNKDLINRLQVDSSLKKICGFKTIPSEATFSRRLSLLATSHIMDQLICEISRKYHEKRIVGHISRDSTAIEAREKPINKKKDVKPRKKTKRKRGRPRKGEIVPPKEEKRLTKQIRLRAGAALNELNRNCTWGCKKNSQGNVHYWKGYKLHLDVTDMGIPVNAVVTGANVHDSQVAIPMEKQTERRLTHLYSLMDSAYDAPQIRSYLEGMGRVGLIDFNKRKKKQPNVMNPAEKKRYEIRSVVERANSQLKDWFIPKKIMLKGFKKISFCLMSAVVCLASVKVLQYFILPDI